MTHRERVVYYEYVLSEGITRQSERIASLEELVLDMAELLSWTVDTYDQMAFADMKERMKRLNVGEHELPKEIRLAIDREDDGQWVKL